LIINHRLVRKIDSKKVKKIIDPNYISVDIQTAFEVIGSLVKEYKKKNGRFPTILILEDGNFLGSLPGHALALAKTPKQLRSYIKKVPTVKYSDGPKKIISTFKRSSYDKLVVLNDDNKVLGIIYSEEILSLIEKETAKNLYAFAGLNQSEELSDTAIRKVKFRHRWLILNLFTAFLAAAVVAMFESTISRMVLLAAYMPVVAGMGGNAATQTLAVMVRGLAINNVNNKLLLKIVYNELIAGFLNGMITAVIIGILALVLGQSILLGLVAGIAVIINLLIAGFFGSVVPVVMYRLGKDPASSATIFITTATDVFGFLAFLGLAQLVF